MSDRTFHLESVLHERFTPAEQDYRLGLAYEAAAVIDSISSHLMRLTEEDFDDAELTVRVLHSLVMRMRQVSGVALSVLGNDDLRETSEMHRAIHGAAMVELFEPPEPSGVTPAAPDLPEEGLVDSGVVGANQFKAMILLAHEQFGAMVLDDICPERDNGTIDHDAADLYYGQVDNLIATQLAFIARASSAHRAGFIRALADFIDQNRHGSPVMGKWHPEKLIRPRDPVPAKSVSTIKKTARATA